MDTMTRGSTAGLSHTLTLASAHQTLGARQERKIAHATTLRRFEQDDETQYAVRYHATDVVTLHPDGSYILRSGGWLSQTTKARINTYAPIHLSAVNGLWYARPAGIPSVYSHVHPFLFTEGMQLTPDGVPVAPVDPAPIEVAKRLLDRQVAAYIKGFIADALANGEVAQPSGGDCWGCHLHAENGALDALGLDHYREHFAESYYVPSLLANALTERNYRDGISMPWHMIQRDLAQGREPHIMRNALTRFFGRRKLALLGTVGITTVPAPVAGWQG